MNRKIILIVLGFALTIFQSCAKEPADEQKEEKSFVKLNGQLSVQGNRMVNQHGKVAALHGVSFGWHNWWPRFYNKGTVRWLVTDWNCTVVRAAIGVEPDGAFIDKPENGYHLLYKVIDAAIADGIYVIVDWHSHNIRTEEAKDFFKTVATKYNNYPNIIYEIFNEPEYDSWEDVKAYSEEIIKTIRAIDPKNIILVGSPHWSQDVHLAADDPIKGYDNIMYTVHFYSASHKQFLRDRVEYALNKGIPVFISECAATQASGSESFDMEEWGQWVKMMDKHQLSYVMWSIADKDELCSMVKDTASPVSHWKESDLKIWGVTVRQLVRSKWQDRR